MSRYAKVSGVLVAAVIAVMWAVPAEAQATRTWISGVGDDVNPCSRTAPCKTFPGAISKTAAGGEIDCLDPGGFGAVTVTKSITLDCGGGIGGQVGSILVVGTNGITINAASTDLVKVRNMSINGIQKTGSPGLSGIKLAQGGALIVEHVGIFGFGGTTGSNGGVDFEPGSSGATGYTAKLNMLDVELQYGLADGVLVKPANGCVVLGVLEHVSALGNGGAGLRVDSTSDASGAGSNVTAFESTFGGNATGILALTPAGTVPGVVEVTNSAIAGNTNNGLLASGANATIVIGGSTVTGNATGLLAAGSSTIKSYGNNYFFNGATGTSNGTPTAPNLTTL